MENGRLKEETMFKDDMKDGLQKTYHYDGNLFHKANYRNDELNGFVKYTIKMDI